MGAFWVLVAWVKAIRAELAAVAPKRGTGSDGTIGDKAHQGTVTGHAPDDTPGWRAERSDADNVPEVRAVDIDADLNVPGLTMAMVVAYLVGRCRAGLEKRLIYIIYRGVIWSASSGWQARKYTGKNPHDKHMHASGHPDGDNDGRPFGLASLLPKPATPTPAPARSAPGPVVAFPLPVGYYFGPKDGPNRSVSGYHGRKFAGRTDSYWLARWATQLDRRGWKVGKGKTWLRLYGNDGKWGDEYRALVRAFQKDQRLPATGLLDKRTWDAAYRNPIR